MMLPADIDEDLTTGWLAKSFALMTFDFGKNMHALVLETPLKAKTEGAIGMGPEVLLTSPPLHIY